MQGLKTMLERYYTLHNTSSELNQENPDPILVLKPLKHKSYSAEIALLCALLSYGQAKAIVKMLQSLDFTLLESVKKILQTDEDAFPYYRFQTRKDIKALFLIIASFLEHNGLKTHFLKAYENPPSSLQYWNKSKNPHHGRILYGIYCCIDMLNTYVQKYNFTLSNGLCFALGKSLSTYMSSKGSIPHHASALKRWNMLLRWLVRKDKIDIGIWQKYLSPANLILPLDTHTFRICNQVGILQKGSYNLQSALQASDTFALMHKDDPIKYDFALYRLGQRGARQDLLI